MFREIGVDCLVAYFVFVFAVCLVWLTGHCTPIINSLVDCCFVWQEVRFLAREREREREREKELSQRNIKSRLLKVVQTDKVGKTGATTKAV